MVKLATTQKWTVQISKDEEGHYLLATDLDGNRRAHPRRFKTSSLAESFYVNVAPPIDDWVLAAPLAGSKAAKKWGFA